MIKTNFTCSFNVVTRKCSITYVACMIPLDNVSRGFPHMRRNTAVPAVLDSTHPAYKCHSKGKDFPFLFQFPNVLGRTPTREVWIM